jgi:lysophospholipid acyltransferase (LPLAT)-like uncharacterized protein
LLAVAETRLPVTFGVSEINAFTPSKVVRRTMGCWVGRRMVTSHLRQRHTGLMCVSAQSATGSYISVVIKHVGFRETLCGESDIKLSSTASKLNTTDLRWLTGVRTMDGFLVE